MQEIFNCFHIVGIMSSDRSSVFFTAPAETTISLCYKGLGSQLEVAHQVELISGKVKLRDVQAGVTQITDFPDGLARRTIGVIWRDGKLAVVIVDVHTNQVFPVVSTNLPDNMKYDYISSSNLVVHFPIGKNNQTIFSYIKCSQLYSNCDEYWHIPDLVIHDHDQGGEGTISHDLNTLRQMETWT